MTVTIASDLLDAIESAARRHYPEEACGLLVGRRAGADCAVSAVHESANVADDRRRHFEVDPGLRLSLQRQVRDTGDAVVGLFHSHPDGEPAPSETDRASIWEPDLIWLVTAVGHDRMPETRAYAVDDPGTDFAPLAMRVA